MKKVLKTTWAILSVILSILFFGPFAVPAFLIGAIFKLFRDGFINGWTAIDLMGIVERKEKPTMDISNVDVSDDEIKAMRDSILGDSDKFG